MAGSGGYWPGAARALDVGLAVHKMAGGQVLFGHFSSVTVTPLMFHICSSFTGRYSSSLRGRLYRVHCLVPPRPIYLTISYTCKGNVSLTLECLEEN
jgi:hypothetical protein